LFFRSADPTAQYALLVRHLRTLQSINTLRNASLVVGVEANLGFEANHVLHALRKAGVPHIALHEGAQESVGVLTTNASKELMCVGLQELIDHKRMVISRQLVSLSASPLETLDTLFKQMNTYTIVVEAPRTPFGKPRRTYTGKVGGNQDDLCIALQLAVLSMRIFQKNDKYKRYL